MNEFFNAIAKWFSDFGNDLYINFVKDDRWKYLTNGLLTTLQITVLAVLVGVVIGFLVAIIRTTHDQTGKLKIPNAICKLYLTVIRGTPVMVQVLIIYFGIFASVDIPKLLVAVIAFGLNSGAYVAEIFRSGIMSIDKGQLEAGRSLGLNYFQTLKLVIMPQAIKNILPAIGNEFITLVKETSVAGYIGVMDLTKASDIIASRTYDYFFPLIIAALIYWCIVIILTKILNLFERSLMKNA